MLYSLAFVTQPLKSMAPLDQAMSKMLNDVVLLVVGGIGGVMSRKGTQAIADKLASTPPAAPPTTPTQTVNQTPPTPSGALPVWINPPLDEEWRAPPPPTTPPDFIDPAKEEIAQERAAARSET